jgi:hypothetical protein
MRIWIFLFILLMLGYVAFAQQLPALKLPIGHTFEINSAQFSPDGNYIVTASEDGTVNIWNLTSGKLLQDLEGHTNGVNSAQFSRDGKSILVTSGDHKTMLWDAATGKMRYSRLQLCNNDWLVYDEHYRYDGSPGARDYLYFVCGMEIVDLAKMKDALCAWSGRKNHEWGGD